MNTARADAGDRAPGALVLRWAWVWAVPPTESEWTSPGLRVEVVPELSDRTPTEPSAGSSAHASPRAERHAIADDAVVDALADIWADLLVADYWARHDASANAPTEAPALQPYTPPGTIRRCH